jgi:hypothetical protein
LTVHNFITGEEGHWLWLHSDEVLTESFWSPGFPNEEPGNADDCGVMVVELDNFWWEDSSCLAPEVHHNAVAVICQCDTDVASTTTTSAASTTTTTAATATTEVTTTTVTSGDSCPSGWHEFDGHCYISVLNRATWDNAEKDCISKGGHLASVHSAEEDLFIFNLHAQQPDPPFDDLWIGGSDTAVEVITTCIYIIHTLYIQGS